MGMHNTMIYLCWVCGQTIGGLSVQTGVHEANLDTMFENT